MWRKLVDRFGKKVPPAPSSDDPKINEDWGAGDIAECIVSVPWLCAASMLPMPGPKKGERYRVLSVELCGVRVDGSKRWFLHLSGWQNSFEANGFRKVIPKKDVEKATDQTWLKKLLQSKVEA